MPVRRMDLAGTQNSSDIENPVTGPETSPADAHDMQQTAMNIQRKPILGPTTATIFSS